jgi:hypothetical protein
MLPESISLELVILITSMAPSTSRPVFFISHSSADLPASDRTVQIRDALAAVLESRGWDAFLDREVLMAGDRWRTNIVYGLSRADAAAILFNDRAISSSDWVTAEALILCFHKSVDPRFQLVPVMLEGKRLSDTAFAKYQPFELNQIQAFPDDATVAPADIAVRIADRFDIQRARTVRSRWCTHMAAVLSNIRDRAALERAALQLKLQVDARSRMAPADVAIEQLSGAIVAVLHHSEPLDVIDALSEIFIPLDDSNRLRVKKHILAKWVPNESVEILMGATRAPRVLTIESMSQAATNQYVNRALIELQGGTVWAFSVSAAVADDDDSIFAHVEDAIRQNMAPAPFYDRDGNELALPQAIREVMSSPADIAICMLPSSCSRETVLSRLLNDYSRLLFVAQAGTTNDPKSFERLKAQRLTPPFTFDRNNQLSRLVSRMEAALARS